MTELKRYYGRRILFKEKWEKMKNRLVKKPSLKITFCNENLLMMCLLIYIDFTINLGVAYLIGHSSKCVR